MATSTNTIKTRIQLKSDTEANWNKAGPKEGSDGFVPLLGELIVYTADSTHPFSRLKIGDGNTNVVSLPFIDAGTINGEVLPEEQVKTYATSSLFPSPGNENTLYIDLSSNIIYCYTYSNGYSQLSNFNFTLNKAAASNITFWRAGAPTTLSCTNGVLNATTGILPQLNYETIQVVTNITKEGAE